MRRTLPTLLLLSPTLFPAAAITHRWAPVVCIVSVKGDMFEGDEQVATSRWRGAIPLAPAHHISSLQAAIIFSPCLWKTCIMGTPITNCCYPRCFRGNHADV